MLVTPNNPTGAVTPPDIIREIAELAIRHDLLVISDEIYAKLLYDDAEHLSIATLPNMRERTITLNGFSKTYAMTGWRVGYLAAPGDFVRRMTEPRHTLSINTSTPSQHAALAALTGHKSRSGHVARISRTGETTPSPPWTSSASATGTQEAHFTSTRTCLRPACRLPHSASTCSVPVESCCFPVPSSATKTTITSESATCNR